MLVMERTSIQVSKKLRDELLKMGKKGETYENIIWKIINKTVD